MTNPSEAVELLPCPFCGGEAYECHISEPSVQCLAGCKVGMVGDTEAEAIAAWNRRADHPPQAGASEQCKKCAGNGEVVTDWDRYLNAEPGDKGDEGTATCPDCGGEGRVDAHPAPQQGVGAVREKVVNLVSRAYVAGKNGWAFDQYAEADAILSALRPPPDSAEPKP